MSEIKKFQQGSFPMIELIEIREKALKGLIKEWERLEKAPSFTSLPHYNTLKFEIPKLDLKNLLTFCDQKTPIFYWADRSHEKEYLGFDSVHQVGDSEFLSVIEDIVGENSDLYYIGGLHFNEKSKETDEWKSFKELKFSLPLVSYERKKQSYSLKINFPKSILFNKREQANFSFQVEKILNHESYSSKTVSGAPQDIDDHEYADSLDDFPEQIKALDKSLYPQKKEWTEMVQEGIKRLKKEQLTKVVLARKKIFKSQTPINPISFFDLCKEESQGKNFTFFMKPKEFQSFLSFSPERLFLLENGKIFVDALAGTRPTDPDPIKDLEFEKELLDSKKDAFEHMVVCKMIHEKLTEFSKKVYMTKNMGIMKLSHVQHLQSEFEAEPEPNFKLKDIIKELHPTPAVGGSPSNKAKDFIASHEPFERGLYASPIGIISKEYTEFAVGIRSALTEKNQIHLFGGAGIVLGSTPEKEWEETQSKMKSFEHYL